MIGAYMVCAVFFVLSLGGLSHQKTAKRGNLYGVIAITLAIVATFFIDEFNHRYFYFLPAFVLGGTIGLVIALKVEMINMPQMVAALHSFVGLAATMVSFGNFFLHPRQTTLEIIETIIGVFIGAITFSGSVVAWGKLQGKIRSSPLIIFGWGRHLINATLASIMIASGVFYALEDDEMIRFYALLLNALISCVIGWHLIMAIGGADMPVVVSMLNSYSGWATSSSGFLLRNDLLIITGALVGSSGAILSYIMCKAMNRSFISVIAGGFGEGSNVTAAIVRKETGLQKEINLDRMTSLLKEAKKIVIVPGYGMAVARCQHDVGSLAAYLIKTGRKVEFCIHPVAGRLPGHMNVLLAEADVDYAIVKEMDKINKEFPQTDLVLVIGANDTVNPDAQDNPMSPISGMPVCEVWKAKNVIVFKRGKGVGYAGIENPLFFKENAYMYFGNADKSIKEILNSVTSRPDDFYETGNRVEHQESTDEENKDYLEEDIPDPMMNLGVPNEIYPLERRVAITPSTVTNFRKLGFKVFVETGAGSGADYADEAYAKAGAEVVGVHEIWNCDIVLKVRKLEYHPVLERHEDTMLRSTKLLVSYLYPANNKEWLVDLAQKYPKLTYLAMECVPRITKAQKLDSLSSMANIGGYRAVMEAFQYYKRTPKPMMTAAGKTPPARILVIGVGVAGLAAIGYCKNLGCIVKAMDTRSAAKTDAESMGAQFVEVPYKEEGATTGGYAKIMSEDYKKAQYEITKKTASRSDIVITTALIPGRPAPLLIDSKILKSMKHGSVVVDMAAEMGGNVEGTVPGEKYITENGVTIVGFTDLASRMAPQTSELYANNLLHLLEELGGAKNFHINSNDEIIGPMVTLHDGSFVWSPPVMAPAKPSELPKLLMETQIKLKKQTKKADSTVKDLKFVIVAILIIAIFIGLSYLTYKSFMQLFMTFVLAVFIGYMVIWNVSPALHTPLMSVTNAISGIIVIGAMLLLNPNTGNYDEGSIIGATAVFFASINIWGGFIVTHRMLSMFRTKGHKKD